LLPELEGMDISEEAVNTMLAECISTNDFECAKVVESIARANQAPLKDSTLVLIIKAFSCRPWRLRPIIKEAVWRDSRTFSPELALAVIDFCNSSSSEKAMADRLFLQMEPKPLNVVAAFICFYANNKHREKACAILEAVLQTFKGDYLRHPITDLIDTRTGWILMMKALQSGCAPLATHIFETTASSTEKRIVTIQKWWKHGYAQKRRAVSQVDAVCVVGSRLSNVFQSASLDYDQDVARAKQLLLSPMKASKTSRRRAASPSGSTNAGSSGESEDEAGDWMEKAAWYTSSPELNPSPPPGLDLPDLDDPWEVACC